MVNYAAISTTVANTIKSLGQSVKITTFLGISTTTYGVWGESTDEEVSDGLTGNITVHKRKLYIPYIKNAPDVGGKILVNKVEYAIDKVTLYKPTDKSIGFCIEVKG